MRPIEIHNHEEKFWVYEKGKLYLIISGSGEIPIFSMSGEPIHYIETNTVMMYLYSLYTIYGQVIHVMLHNNSTFIIHYCVKFERISAGKYLSPI